MRLSHHNAMLLCCLFFVDGSNVEEEAGPEEGGKPAMPQKRARVEEKEMEAADAAAMEAAPEQENLA